VPNGTVSTKRNSNDAAEIGVGRPAPAANPPAAQPVTGLYIGGGAGYILPENAPLSSGGSIEPGGGVVGLGSVGHGLANGFRFELEGDY
jgi:hypothetical protein